MDGFRKRHILMRGWLLGRGYYVASEAMDYASALHTGLRKDGRTPEFAHQIQIAHYVRTLAGSLIDPEATLAIAFLHDVCEDFNIGFEEIQSRFGAKVCSGVELLTKKHRGETVPSQVYFSRIADNAQASIVKGIDRTHNIQSMLGVFSQEKQTHYVEEVESYFLPMLKKARRAFHSQEPAYENIKHMLVSQIELIRAIHAAHEAS